MPALWVFLGLLAVFLLVILVRAARFTPRPEPRVEPARVAYDVPTVTEHLARMVRVRTVSAPAERDEAQFEAFRELLRELYPQVHAACERERIGDSGVLYRWPGRAAEAPLVLMAHYDVVPSDGRGWSHDPFSGDVDGEGVLWGRGTLDTKGTLCGILEAVEGLISAGYVPERDVYLSFSGDEEIMGPSAPAIVDALQARGVRPGLVLDEGGAVVEGVFPGVTRRAAVVGVGEKGQMRLAFTCESKAGHTSAPPPRTAVDALCRAVVRVAEHPSPARLTPAAAALFDTLGRHSSFSLRLVFANLWCFWPLLALICRKAGGELNALVRTTRSFTMLQGSAAFNVFPAKARMDADVRILSGESMAEATERLRRVIGDGAIQIERVSGCEPSPISPAAGPAWERVSTAIAGIWPGAVVTPYLMVARSDSSNFCRISENVYRFSAMELSKAERGKIHGIDECVPGEKIARAAAFFERVIRGNAD